MPLLHIWAFLVPALEFWNRTYWNRLFDRHMLFRKTEFIEELPFLVLFLSMSVDFVEVPLEISFVL